MNTEAFDDYEKIEMSDIKSISHDDTTSQNGSNTPISLIIQQANNVAEQLSDILPKLGELTHELYVGSCRLCHAIMLNAIDYVEAKI